LTSFCSYGFDNFVACSSYLFFSAAEELLIFNFSLLVLSDVFTYLLAALTTMSSCFLL
jgi:hypothetical protein